MWRVQTRAELIMQPLLYGYLPILVFLVIAGGIAVRDGGRLLAGRAPEAI